MSIMRSVIIILFVILYSSCSVENSNTVEDTQKGDTGKTVMEEGQEVNEEFDYASEKDRFVQGYNKRSIIIDTVIKSKRIIATYYCLFDSSIVVPSKYISQGSDTSFITHNFALDVDIVNGADTILKKTITKELLNAKLSTELKKYGVIMSPYFHGYNEANRTISIGLSVTIPITDIGKGLQVMINEAGSITVNEE